MTLNRFALTAKVLCFAVVIGALLDDVALGQVVQSIVITDFGLYTSQIDKTVNAPGTAAGTNNLVSDIKLLESTTTIPARLGSNFGFRYRIIGEGKSVTVKLVTHIPEPGLRNPETGNTNVTSVVYIERSIGAVNFTSYSFDHDWEVVPGTWTKEIWVGDRKLASQSFNVVKQ